MHDAHDAVRKRHHCASVGLVLGMLVRDDVVDRAVLLRTRETAIRSADHVRGSHVVQQLVLEAEHAVTVGGVATPRRNVGRSERRKQCKRVDERLGHLRRQMAGGDGKVGDDDDALVGWRRSTDGDNGEHPRANVIENLLLLWLAHKIVPAGVVRLDQFARRRHSVIEHQTGVSVDHLLEFGGKNKDWTPNARIISVADRLEERGGGGRAEIAVVDERIRLVGGAFDRKRVHELDLDAGDIHARSDFGGETRDGLFGGRVGFLDFSSGRNATEARGLADEIVTHNAVDHVIGENDTTRLGDDKVRQMLKSRQSERITHKAMQINHIQRTIGPLAALAA